MSTQNYTVMSLSGKQFALVEAGNNAAFRELREAKFNGVVFLHENVAVIEDLDQARSRLGGRSNIGAVLLREKGVVGLSPATWMAVSDQTFESIDALWKWIVAGRRFLVVEYLKGVPVPLKGKS